MRFSDIKRALFDGEKVARESWQKGTTTYFYIRLKTVNKSKPIEQQLLVLYMSNGNETHDICTWSLSAEDITGSDWYIVRDGNVERNSTTKEEYIPGWICPNCSTVHSPLVLSCDCLKHISTNTTNDVCKEHEWLFEACVGVCTAYSHNQYKCTKCGQRKIEKEYYKEDHQISFNEYCNNSINEALNKRGEE